MNLIEQMQSCEYTPGQSVLEYGQSVYEYFRRILNICLTGVIDPAIKVPDQMFLYRKWAADEIDIYIMYFYLLYHNCGKSFCKRVDENGKSHFPDHAAVSKATYALYFPLTPFTLDIQELIGYDMVIHTANREEIAEHLKVWKPETAIALCFSALAEVHSNAMMFGGLDSTSFKIKYKRIEKNINFIFKHYKPNPNKISVKLKGG